MVLCIVNKQIYDRIDPHPLYNKCIINRQEQLKNTADENIINNNWWLVQNTHTHWPFNKYAAVNIIKDDGDKGWDQQHTASVYVLIFLLFCFSSIKLMWECQWEIKLRSDEKINYVALSEGPFGTKFCSVCHLLDGFCLAQYRSVLHTCMQKCL